MAQFEMFPRFKAFAQSEFKAGSPWFFLANLLPPLTAVFLGPAILRKLGLENYAHLSLALYFYYVISSYSDFSTNTHLLIAFANNHFDKKKDFVNSIFLRTSLFVLFYTILATLWFFDQNSNPLYILLMILSLSIPLAPANIEWYFTSRKNYFPYFMGRLLLSFAQLTLTIAWYFSTLRGIKAIAWITPISFFIGFLYLVLKLDRSLWKTLATTLKMVSFNGISDLAKKTFPIAATSLLTPYFFAYSLPWLSALENDKRSLGAFSVAYRIVMGMSALIGPTLIYLIPRSATQKTNTDFFLIIKKAMLFTALLWLVGIPIIFLYFGFSLLHFDMFLLSLKSFSILMIGILCLCIRLPLVGKCLSNEGYAFYFWSHLIGCAPILLLSIFSGKIMPPHLVVWVACTPDIIVTSIFIYYNSSARKQGARSFYQK